MLENVSLFAALSDEERAEVERFSVYKRYKKNTILIEKGDEANRLFLLMEGQVKIYVSGEEGKEVVVNQLGPGDYFGELALLGAEERTASAVTLTDSVLMVISRMSLLQLIEKRPEMAMTLLKDLVVKVKKLTEEVSSLALMDVYGRIARLLTESAKDDQGRMITRRFTHHDIANRVGSSREMVSKILRDLVKGGYLSTDNKRFIIEKKLPRRW